MPQNQDANRYNIRAAKTVGLTVCAGSYRQGADPGYDAINVELTKS